MVKIMSHNINKLDLTITILFFFSPFGQNIFYKKEQFLVVY